MIAKNLNADLTNPNVYNSLEGLKEEHVYDEIKHKEGLKDPGKYTNYSYFHVLNLSNTLLDCLFALFIHFHCALKKYTVKNYKKILFHDGKNPTTINHISFCNRQSGYNFCFFTSSCFFRMI